jgi:hypothetical protein
MTDIFTHRIEIYTEYLVIVGSYDLSLYRRVSDALNGEPRRYIPLRDATVAPLVRPQQAQRVPQVLIDRSEIILMASIEEAAPPPDYPRDEQVRGVEPVAAMLFTGSFALRATFHKRPNLSLSEALERLDYDFMPLSNVQIYALGGQFAPQTRQFAAVAASQIGVLYPVGEAAKDETEPKPAPSAPELPAGEPTANPSGTPAE